MEQIQYRRDAVTQVDPSVVVGIRGLFAEELIPCAEEILEETRDIRDVDAAIDIAVPANEPWLHL